MGKYLGGEGGYVKLYVKIKPNIHIFIYVNMTSMTNNIEVKVIFAVVK